MMMTSAMVAELAPVHAMVPTPALVAYATILALSGPDLDQAVARELHENPVLVVDDATRGPSATFHAVADHDVPRTIDGPQRSRPDAWSRSPVAAADWASHVDAAAAEGWREAVLRDLRLEVPSEDAEVASLVVGCLDERGLLADDPMALGIARGMPAGRVARVLAVLRATGAPGIGARDVRHCLALQLERAPDLPPRALALSIVDAHLEDLAAGRAAAIARALQVVPWEVGAARDYILAHARPYPAIDAAAGDRRQGAVYVRPDVAIIAGAGASGSYRVEVIEARRYALHVDGELRTAAREAGAVPLLDLVRRADFFLDRLRERWTTLRRIAAYVAERQRGLIEGGPAHSVPLSRAMVARDLGLHESTVSRAIAGKYVELPSRTVVPFASFFDPAAGAREALRDILHTERRPMTDAELTTRLAQRGYRLARRTVAKYRDALGVLPAARRGALEGRHPATTSMRLTASPR